MDIHRFNLDARGLARVLGELEARIMEVVWQEGLLSGPQICAALGEGSHYKTVLTVANRLVDKGLLSRERRAGRSYQYRATETREAFVQRVSATVANELVRDFGAHALAQLVQAADELSPAYLDELERLVRERREQR